MRLSIFSSDRSSFRRTWRRTWLVALLLAATGCLATELFWRWQGFTPSASDTKGLWAYHRSRATEENALVLIGASRTQTDLYLDTLAEFFPDRPILQLAVAGRSPIATLEELSRNDDFRGDLICGVAEPFLDPRQWDEQTAHIEYYQRQPLRLPFWEKACIAWLQSRLVFLHPELQWPAVLHRYFTTGRFPKPSARTMRFDRYRPIRFEKLDLEKINREQLLQLQQKWNNNPPDLEEWNDGILKIEAMVRRLHARGCRVVFVRFPTSGPRTAIDDAAYPPGQFWNSFVSGISAPVVDARSEPALSEYTCPDMSHLSEPDARRFTRELAELILRKEWVSDKGESK